MGTRWGRWRSPSRPTPTSGTGASAGVDHPTLRAGALYPPIAANLTILAVPDRGRPATDPDRASGSSPTAGPTPGVELTVTGTVTERYEKRGREYAVVDAEITLPDGVAALDVSRHVLRGGGRGVMKRAPRSHPGACCTATRGAATSTPIPTRPPPRHDRLVAQGMQVAGPAYGLLLDEWGDDFLAHGTIELKFVGLVRRRRDRRRDRRPGDRRRDARSATNRTSGRTSVVGHATPHGVVTA